jgi:zinc protease
VGDLDVAHACDAVDRALGGWRRPVPAEIALPPVVPVSGRRRVVVPMMNKAQVDIAYGFTAIRRADPAHEAFRLMNNVLGQYALGGRLGDSIRERQGMAYYVSSALDANVLEGPLTIRAGVSPDNVDRAVSSIDDELAHLCANGVTAKELDDSRRYLVGAMPLALETNAAIAAFLQMVEFHSLGLDYDLRLPDLLRAVTLDEVNAAARAVLDPSRATVVIAGPYRT